MYPTIDMKATGNHIWQIMKVWILKIIMFMLCERYFDGILGFHLQMASREV